jgi:hypothetical protein
VEAWIVVGPDRIGVSSSWNCFLVHSLSLNLPAGYLEKGRGHGSFIPRPATREQGLGDNVSLVSTAEE